MDDSFSLDGEWRLVYFPEGQWNVRSPQELLELGLPTIPAAVPGNVELDIQRAGLIPDPFYAQNIHTLRPFEVYEWWYLREFTFPRELTTPTKPAGETWELVFSGLDTLATIWVNGVEVGRAENMLIEHRFDVTGALKSEGINHVAVRLASSLNNTRQRSYDAATLSWERREEGLYLRKPPHCWGWDIMPRLVSAGLWRSVSLERKPAVAIEQLYTWTIATGRVEAVLGVRYQFRTPDPDLAGYSLLFEGVSTGGEHRFTYECPAEFIAGGCRISIPGARLWWPRGYGRPNLYTLTTRLVRGGEILAERIDRIGLRKLVLRRTETIRKAWQPTYAAAGRHRQDVPPDPESSFIFYVNGEPVQIKGTNWVPLDAFHSRDRERLGPAMDMAVDLGCNMIRCWGGNVYEQDRFFDLCDENGILVWQDFAFACCRYPQSEAFLEAVREEVQSVVQRLRNHPCLAVWCGDNEVDMIYDVDGLSPEHNRVSRLVIPETLHSCDPFRAYVPSSPYIAPAVQVSTGDHWIQTPEQHLWGPRGYFKSPYYTAHSAHFIGEIGYHGCPNTSSVRRFISPEKVWPWQDNPEWRAHDVTHLRRGGEERDRILLMANQVREFLGQVPDDLETFALASQITQAEANKFFIESTRLRKWYTSGLIWWNLLDGWPQFSDAVVDYYFGKKLAYHYIRRAQQPVALFFGEPGTENYLPLVVCNDSLEPALIHYRVWEADGGAILLEGEFTAHANQNWQVERLHVYSSDQRLFLLEWEIGVDHDVSGKKYGSHYLSGFPPFSLSRYCAWLPQIAALPETFDPATVAR